MSNQIEGEPVSHSQEADASTLEQCLRFLGANDEQSAFGGQPDPLNPEMDWRWHFQSNVRDLPCSIQSDHDVESPWQLLHDLQQPAQQAGYPITLLPQEVNASFESFDRVFSWPDDEPLEVREFVTAFADCFAPDLLAFHLGYFPEEEGEEIVCVLMTSEVGSKIRALLGDAFEENFVALMANRNAPRFQSHNS
jgi:hypothetical protein